MVIRPEILEFASKSLKTCLGSVSPKTFRGSRSNDRSKVPLYLLDLWEGAWDPDPRQRLVRVVHRKTIPDLGAVEWATLSYARGYMATSCGVIDGVHRLGEIHDIMIPRNLVPAHALYNAIDIVDHLEIRYLWVDMLCPYWDQHDPEGGPKSYANTFQGAKINIQLPDNDFWVLDQLVEELKEVNEMAKAEFYPTLGDGIPAPKLEEPKAGKLDVFFPSTFVTDSWACLDRLLSPRKLFCLLDGEAVWACNHHCTHSRYGSLYVDPRSCLLVLPEHRRPRPRLLPPSTSASPLASSSSPTASRPQEKPSGVHRHFIKETQQRLEGSKNNRSPIRKSIAGPKRKANKSLREKVAERALLKSTVERGTSLPLPQGSTPGPCTEIGKGVIQEDPPFAMVIETLHRCLFLLNDQDKFGIYQVLIQAYGFEKSIPALSEWISNIGHLPEDLIWLVDGWKSMLSMAHDWNHALSISWLHWVGRIVFLSCFRWSNRPSASSNSSATDTKSKGTISPHHSYKSHVGRLPRGFDITCAQFNGPEIPWTEPRDPDADRMFATLRKASVSGGSTFLGAGLTADEPWNYDPPQLQYSKPCYIYDHRGGLMGRGVVDDPEWFEGEQAKIDENLQRGDANCRIFTLAFIMRESLELRVADLPSRPPLPWDLELVSSVPAACAEQIGCNYRDDIVALEVNYGLILLTSGRDEKGNEERDEGFRFDKARYERVGVFEVYGTEYSGGNPRQIYVC